LDVLNTEFGLFAKAHPITAQEEINPQEGTHTVRIRLSAPPGRLRLLFADFVCNLRFSLDHLAWELALLKTSSPFDRTEFPVCTTWDKGIAKLFDRLTQSLPGDARAEINALQPYHRVEGPKFHALAVLDYFCNIAKHRTVPMGDTHLRLNARNATPYENFDDGTIEFTIPYEENFKPDPSGDIVFGATRKGQMGISLRIGELQQMYDFVANRVFPRFDRFFP
jgi:hypothetical protein